MPAVKLRGNQIMSRLISRMIGQRFYDVSCGMRCYNRRAAMNLNTIGAFTYTQEVFLNLAYKRLRMVEVPIKVHGRRKHGTSRVAGNVFKYAFNAMGIIFRCYRDYRPMRFFGRLAAGVWGDAGSGGCSGYSHRSGEDHAQSRPGRPRHTRSLVARSGLVGSLRSPPRPDRLLWEHWP
jgi:hypothetical protein